MSDQEYICSACGGQFTATRPDEEARAEREALFGPRQAAEEDDAIVCDDCWRLIMGLPPKSEAKEIT